MDGRGIKQVRERVQKEFERIRQELGHDRAGNHDMAGPKVKLVIEPTVKPELTPVETHDMKQHAVQHEVQHVKREPKPELSLQQKAEILANRVPATGLVMYRRHDRQCWDLGDEPAVDDLNKLFDAALIALGYWPEKPATRQTLMCTAEPEKKSLWKRDIFKRAVR